MTAITFEPGCKAIADADQFAVPVHTPLPPVLFVHVTDVIEKSLNAVPVMLTLDVFVSYVAADVGDVKATIGALGGL